MFNFWLLHFKKQDWYWYFKVPLPTTDFNKKWRQELIAIITKGRVVDASLKRQIKTNTLHICKWHFREEQLYFYPTRKALKGVHPTLNLPVKSIASPSVARSTVAVEKECCIIILITVYPLHLWFILTSLISSIVFLSCNFQNHRA